MYLCGKGLFFTNMGTALSHYLLTARLCLLASWFNTLIVCHCVRESQSVIEVKSK